MTRQGTLVEDAIRAADGFRSAQELHAMLQAAGARVGLATVYRHLQRLEHEGLLDNVVLDDGRIAYRYCGASDHHHHLVCRRCGTAVEIHEPTVERWAESAARRAHFTEVTHTVEVFGLCPTCSGVAS